MSLSALSGNTDTRRKQTKKDEAIRKKIESELARKRTISTTPASNNYRSRKGGKSSGAQKGTVAALKPSQALTVPDNITVADASQLCAAKRTDCVLVVDDEEGLIGIFTAKDLAFRVTAEGLDPRTTLVSSIMTRNPMVTRDTTSATEALQLMVQRGFRHLPVCNEDGNVVGLLDITKVFHEALDKVERGSSASQQLYSALESVQNELGGVGTNPKAAAMMAFVESLRDKTALPDLTTVMNDRTQPATVGPRTTVRDAARLMKENRTTAVCVMEGGANTAGQPSGTPARIAGIFTSKDVVLRVIAAGLDPNRCSVVRVMTPHPDCAPPTMTIQDALKKMHNGHYLNLPVVEGDGRLVAIVDVLKLTYATLEQMNALAEATTSDNNESGPMWGHFFNSIGNDDNDSVVSGSHLREVLSPVPGYSEVHPHDSASMVDDDASEAPHTGRSGAMSSVSRDHMDPPPVDDGTYVFKFATPSGRTHRFQSRKDDYEHLRDIITGKLSNDPFFTEHIPEEDAPPRDHHEFNIMYKDSDGDIVTMTSDTDVIDAVAVARNSKTDRVVLTIQGGKGWALDDPKTKAAVEDSARKLKEEAEKAEEAARAGEPKSKAVRFDPGDDIYGIPRDLVLPASLGALAVVIVAVFTISRLTRD